MQAHPEHYKCNTAGGGTQLIMVWTPNFLTQRLQGGNALSRGNTSASHGCSKNDLDTVDQRFIHPVQIPENHFAQHIGLEMLRVSSERNWPAQELPPKCENHARKMRTFFTRRLEPKTKSSNAFKWSLRPKRK